MSEDYDLVIIGAGPGGLSAGIYGVRSGLKAIVLEMGAPGGQTAIAPWVENYPGFKEVSGMELMNNITEHAQEYVEVRTGQYVKSIERSQDGLTLKTDNTDYKAKAIIFCRADEQNTTLPKAPSLLERTKPEMSLPSQLTCIGFNDLILAQSVKNCFHFPYLTRSSIQLPCTFWTCI